MPTHREILLRDGSAEGVVDVGEVDDEILVPSLEAVRSGGGGVHNQWASDTVGVLSPV